MGTVEELCERFDNLILKDSQHSLQLFDNEYKEFMYQRTEQDLNPDKSTRILVRNTPISRMMIAATLPTDDFLKKSEREAILINTAITTDQIPTLSGKKEVRRSLRSVEKFYWEAIRDLGEGVLSLTYWNRIIPITSRAFQTAQDLRAFQTSELEHTGLFDREIDRVGMFVYQLFKEAVSDPKLDSNLNSIMYLKALKTYNVSL